MAGDGGQVQHSNVECNLLRPKESLINGVVDDTERPYLEVVSSAYEATMKAFANVKKAADILPAVRKPMLLHCRLCPGMYLKPGRESMECKDRCRPIDYNFNAAAQAAFDKCVRGEGSVQDLLVVRCHYRSAVRQLQRGEDWQTGVWQHGGSSLLPLTADWLKALGWTPEVQRMLEFSVVEGTLPDQQWGSAPFETVVEIDGHWRVVSCFAPWTNPEHHRFKIFLLALYQRALTRPQGSGVQNPEPLGTLQQPTVARSGIPVHGRLFTFLWHLHKQLDAIAPTLGGRHEVGRVGAGPAVGA